MHISNYRKKNRRDFLKISGVLAGIFALESSVGVAVGEEPSAVATDVCVYGGTASGILAAVAVAKRNKSVILIEPSRWRPKGKRSLR